MMKVGTIGSIWRYPVKGLAGEYIQSGELDSRGLKGDRIWAVQDVKRQEIQSCKFRPQLLQCRARYLNNCPDECVEITFPNGEVIQCNTTQASEQVSALVGYESLLQPLRGVVSSDFYRRYKPDNHTWLDELKSTFAREEGESLPDLDNLPQSMQDYVSIPGTFFLVSPFHILTTASLKYMKQKNPDSDWHVERFRPNIVIDTLPEVAGLVEQEWIGKKLKIGETLINCAEAAPRCGAVIRAQSSFNQDSSILRSIVREANQNLGIYGNISNKGVISVGDNVFLV
jgi:uncharacterized protein YcbX